MDLGGVSEVASELGISPQRMRVLRTSRDRAFPDPIAELSAGPVWDLDEIRMWRDGRAGPGRPKTTTLGSRFDLDPEPIGRGGFADVFRAVDRGAADELVAVKVLREAETGDHAERFKRELRLLEQMRDPNVVRVISSGTDRKGRPWYAMPLAVGSLDDVLAEIEGDDAVIEIALQICDGLAYLHSKPDGEGGCIIHRDLCPANVLRTDESTWAIADFGLAREAERRSVALTTSSVIAGHIQYIPPEQLGQLKAAGITADIFGLGRTIQAMVLKRPPAMLEEYDGDSVLRPVIRRATHSDPQQRYQSVQEVVNDLVMLETYRDGQWESPDSRMNRLVEKITDAEPNSQRVIREFRTAVLELRDNAALMRIAVKAFEHLSREDLEYLSEDMPTLRDLVRLWGQATQIGSFEFGFCDLIAEFGEQVLSLTSRDHDILESVVSALIELGANHRRWFVRDTVTRILQQTRDTDEVLVVLGALRACRKESVQWSITPFAVQSMHPGIREYLMAAAS